MIQVSELYLKIKKQIEFIIKVLLFSQINIYIHINFIIII